MTTETSYFADYTMDNIKARKGMVYKGWTRKVSPGVCGLGGRWVETRKQQLKSLSQ
jgi:hypothetical protein